MLENRNKMEFLIRLALVEKALGKTFLLFIRALHEIIYNLVENFECDSFRKINLIFIPYLHDSLFDPEVDNLFKCIGAGLSNGYLTFRKIQKVEELREIKNTLERKIQLVESKVEPQKSLIPKECYNNEVSDRYLHTASLRILNTPNKFLVQMEDQLNFMLSYEDEKYLSMAKKIIPIEELNLKAMARVRAVQNEMKQAMFKDVLELSIEDALVLELLFWFKGSFFSWVDAPCCKDCGSMTSHHTTHIGKANNETCRIEVYRCVSCKNYTDFPRFRCPATLLSTRRGRCGEWASCFTLILRALGYDARFVADTTDHVWNEYYSVPMQRWVHVDSCEAAFDTPLMYEIGWQKKVKYVIAYSWDDIQDVTWRYSCSHVTVKSRRDLCSESELVNAIMSLRASRPISPNRRAYLRRRTLRELCELLVEPSKKDGDNAERKSGSSTWRLARGEARKIASERVFTVGLNGATLSYNAAKDAALWNGVTAGKWSDMLFQGDGIDRKVEHDWKMAYLARSESNSEEGKLSWCFESSSEYVISRIKISSSVKCYENGSVVWTICCDSDRPKALSFDGDTCSETNLSAKRVLVSAVLSGGRGASAWQHAQIARQRLDETSPGISFTIDTQRV